MSDRRPADDEFKTWFSDTLKKLMPLAEKNIKDGTQHAPMLLVFSPTGKCAPFPVSLNTPTEKHTAVRMQNFMANKRPMVAAAILVFESWMLLVEDGVMPDTSKSFEHHPKRVEALVYSAARENMQLMAYCQIERPANTLRPPSIQDPMAHNTPATGNFVIGSDKKEYDA